MKPPPCLARRNSTAMMTISAVPSASLSPAKLATWPKVIDMPIAVPDAVAPMITHPMPLSEGFDAVALAHRHAGSKVLLVPAA
jgi:hypothetical protein